MWQWMRLNVHYCMQTTWVNDEGVLKTIHFQGKMKRWMERHLTLWRSPCRTQKQDWELISGPNLATGALLLSFNRTQSRTVIGLLTRHNIFRRHLHVMGLNNSPTCRKCGTEEETSVHILCECETLASLRHMYLGSFFLVAEDIRVLGVGLC
jgi:hypothetical protein